MADKLQTNDGTLSLIGAGTVVKGDVTFTGGQNITFSNTTATPFPARPASSCRW